MESRIETVNSDKVTAALEKLQSNPGVFGPVEDALSSMLTRLNLDLNQQEAMALMQGLFGGQDRLASDDPVITHSTCPVTLIAYACTSCNPNKPSQCSTKPSPVPPLKKK